MEISRIRIGGFRNISEMNVSFDEVTALVGLNGYGKSNVIDGKFVIAQDKEQLQKLLEHMNTHISEFETAKALFMKRGEH